MSFTVIILQFVYFIFSFMLSYLILCFLLTVNFVAGEPVRKKGGLSVEWLWSSLQTDKGNQALTPCVPASHFTAALPLLLAPFPSCFLLNE